MEFEQAAQAIKGSFASKILFALCGGKEQTKSRRDSVKESIIKSIETYKEQSKRRIDTDAAEMQRAAFCATRSIYGVVLSSSLIIIGVSLIGWTISLNTLEHGLYEGICKFLMAFTVFFQVCFIFVAFFIWEATSLLSYLDLSVMLITPFADWFWFKKVRHKRFLG